MARAATEPLTAAKEGAWFAPTTCSMRTASAFYRTRSTVPRLAALRVISRSSRHGGPDVLGDAIGGSRATGSLFAYSPRPKRAPPESRQHRPSETPM